MMVQYNKEELHTDVDAKGFINTKHVLDDPFHGHIVNGKCYGFTK